MGLDEGLTQRVGLVGPASCSWAAATELWAAFSWCPWGGGRQRADTTPGQPSPVPQRARPLSPGLLWLSPPRTRPPQECSCSAPPPRSPSPQAPPAAPCPPCCGAGAYLLALASPPEACWGAGFGRALGEPTLSGAQDREIPTPPAHSGTPPPSPLPRTPEESTDPRGFPPGWLRALLRPPWVPTPSAGAGARVLTGGHVCLPGNHSGVVLSINSREMHSYLVS